MANSSTSIKAIMGAIFKVQQGVGEIKKASKGQVGTRQYSYANMNDTWAAIKPLMAQNSLVYTQSPTTGGASMGQFFETTIYHTESGEWISQIMQMSLQKDDPQGIGSAITYYRRYMLTSMLGLITDDDNDARDHSLATAQQKAQIVGAVKETYPEVTKSEEIIQVIMNIVGKYPGNIRQDEAADAVALIKAFGTK